MDAHAPQVQTAFYEDFSSDALDPKRWVISRWTAPRHGQNQQAWFDPSHVSIEHGELKLTLQQVKNLDGSITSIGGEVATVAKFGYGVYEVVARVSSTATEPTRKGTSVSGSITGFFNYLGVPEPSTTEIDLEFEGVPERSSLTQLTTWTANASEMSKVKPGWFKGDPHEGFHAYGFVWYPNRVEYYRDGKLLKTHANVVPKLAAPFVINHWGTNDLKWGGKATPGVERYVWVKSFSYKPLVE